MVKVKIVFAVDPADYGYLLQAINFFRGKHMSDRLADEALGRVMGSTKIRAYPDD